jgi:hypothetical protein
MKKKVMKRVYVVGAEENLVRAANNLQARNHVARRTIPARLASQDDLLRLAGSRQVEEAGDDAQQAGLDNT